MFDNNKMSQQHGQSGTVTKGEWFKLDLIVLIPLVSGLVGGLVGGLLKQPLIGALIAGLGSLAVLVLYIVIAVSGKTAPSLRNRVQLTLIYAVVSIVLGIVISVLVIVPNLGTIKAQMQQVQEAQNTLQALNSGDYSSLYGNSTTGDLTADDLNSLYSDYYGANGNEGGYGNESDSLSSYGDDANAGSSDETANGNGAFDDNGLFSNNAHF